ASHLVDLIRSARCTNRTGTVVHGQKTGATNHEPTVGRYAPARRERPPMTGPRSGPGGPDLTIGVVGPHDLGERVMLMGHGPAPVPSRLVAAAYRDEQEAAEKVMRLGSGVDVCLFASPVPFDFARKAGVLTMPATYVPLNGAALQGALLRAALDERY